MDLVVFTGPRKNLGEVLGAFENAGTPAADHSDDRGPSEKFHAQGESTQLRGPDRPVMDPEGHDVLILVDENWEPLKNEKGELEGKVLRMYDEPLIEIIGQDAYGNPLTRQVTEPGDLLEDDDGVPVMSVPIPEVDADGMPVFETVATIEVLATDLATAAELAERHGYRERMHGPSGFESIEEAREVEKLR